MAKEYKYEKYTDNQLKQMLKEKKGLIGQKEHNEFLGIKEELEFRSKMEKKLSYTKPNKRFRR